jgi:hypothetical protein
MKRVFVYTFDGKDYAASFNPATGKYLVYLYPDTQIGEAWSRKPVSGFAGKLTVGWPSNQRVIECGSLKDLVWWLAMEYHYYLKEKED